MIVFHDSKKWIAKMCAMNSLLLIYNTFRNNQDWQLVFTAHIFKVYQFRRFIFWILIFNFLLNFRDIFLYFITWVSLFNQKYLSNFLYCLPKKGESFAVSGETGDRDYRSQSLIFFERYYYLAVKLKPLIFPCYIEFSVSSKSQSNEAHHEAERVFVSHQDWRHWPRYSIGWSTLKYKLTSPDVITCN